MKAIKLIKQIELNSYNQSSFITFRYEGDDVEAFVKENFGGELISGELKHETDYVSFCEGEQPSEAPDALLTGSDDTKYYIYEVE